MQSPHLLPNPAFCRGLSRNSLLPLPPSPPGSRWQRDAGGEAGRILGSWNQPAPGRPGESKGQDVLQRQEASAWGESEARTGGGVSSGCLQPEIQTTQQTARLGHAPLLCKSRGLSSQGPELRLVTAKFVLGFGHDLPQPQACLGLLGIVASRGLLEPPE